MYKAIHFNGSKLLKSENYLRGQDIVYRSPAYRGYDALPFGDGDTTYLFWNTKRDMVFHINKSDAIDFGPDGDFKAWSWESEEKNTVQVHCARILVGDSMPSFDTLYLSDFEQRLIIADGRINMRSETPFSKWSCSAFASFDDKVMTANITSSSNEPVERRITLEAWGSRSYAHFYEQIVNDSTKRTDDTFSGQKNGAVYVMRKLSGTVVVTCIKVIGATCEINQPNSHTAQITLPKKENEKFILIAATVAAKSDEGLVDKAIILIDKAAEDINKVEERNKNNWQRFWEKSFVHLQDDYLENLYNFNLYTLNCCSRGKYPVNTLGGAWTWNADARNWGHYYHWNSQQTFWGLEESNHADLAMNYYEFRSGMLKNAESDAKQHFNAAGAFFSDICNYNGYQAIEPDTVRNLTVGPQIALDLYRHYKYSGDKEFLKNKAYPIMSACLDFYIGLLKKDDGVYHITGGSSAYESYWNLKDTVTDYCMIKTLIAAVIETENILETENTEKNKLKEIADMLFDIPVTTADVESGKGVKVLAAGIKWDGDAVGFTEGDYPWSPFVACQLSAIYPSGLIGLKDSGTRNFEVALNTARVILDTEFYQSGKMGCSGHTPIPQVIARLGMKSDMLPVLKLFVQKYQRFPNGFMHYLDRNSEDFNGGDYKSRLLSRNEKDTVWNNVHEKSDGIRTNLSKDEFIHMYYEPSSNFMCGINEMLLQSHDGVIRVFPAAQDGYTAAFTLLAQGNFIVTSEMIEGEIRYIAIKSQIGGRCRVDIPWQCDYRIRKSDEEIQFQAECNEAVFETECGCTYVLERREFPLSMYYMCALNPENDADVKRMGSAVLGMERKY